LIHAVTQEAAQLVHGTRLDKLSRNEDVQAKLQCRTAAGSKVGEGRSIGSYADLISDKVCRRLLDAVFGPDSDASGPKI
jgi:hypothetical protein